MLIELLLSITFGVLELLINGFSVVIDSFGIDIPTEFYSLIAKGLYFAGTDTFITAITVILSWYIVQFTWAIIEWSYKKIPGVS